MKLSFAQKLTASYLFVVAITLLFTAAFLTPRLQRHFLNQLEQSLAAQASLIADSIQANLAQASLKHNLHDLAHHYGDRLGLRVTMIRRDGLVVGDSERTPDELAKMDNHLYRPEIQAALSAGTGQSIRHSATLNENMLYVAVPVAAAGVLRVAMPLTQVEERISALRQDLLKAGSAAMGVALIVALISVKRINQPLKQLIAMAEAIGAEPSRGRGVRSWTTPVSKDEFGRLAKTLSDMASKIEENVGELSRERTELAAMLSALIEGVIALDHEGRVLLINPAAERLFDVEFQRVKNRPFLEALRHSPLNQILTQTMASQEPQREEMTLHSPAERILSVQTIPINYGGGQNGVLAALHDLTELRKLERVRQEFVANASHELKTPLTSIMGYVETLLDGALEDPPNNREFVQTIQDQGFQLMRLIEDLLDLSAIEARRVDYRFEPIAVDAVADRIVQSLAPMAKAKKVRIDVQLDRNLPPVRADREKLAQILLNLMDNAIKFNRPEGRVELKAVVQARTLTLSVKDTGTGIAPEDLPRVFERFYRVDKAHSHDIPGTGLGLAIVKHLVEAHQGSVTVESVPGEGSTFQFTLPLA